MKIIVEHLFLFIIGLIIASGLWFYGNKCIKQKPELNKLIQQEQELSVSIEHLLIVRGLILCESSWNKDAIGDNGRSFGLGQFQQKTFDWLKKKANMPNLKWKDAHDQIILLIWAVENDYTNLWSCSRKVVKNEILSN